MLLNNSPWKKSWLNFILNKLYILRHLWEKNKWQKTFIYNLSERFVKTRPEKAYGQQGLDWIVGPEYSFRVFSMWEMKNQPGTMKNHESWPGTMKNQPGTLKNHENRTGTMKNQPWKTNREPWITMKTELEPWKTNLVPWKTWKQTWNNEKPTWQ